MIGVREANAIWREGGITIAIGMVGMEEEEEEEEKKKEEEEGGREAVVGGKEGEDGEGTSSMAYMAVASAMVVVVVDVGVTRGGSSSSSSSSIVVLLLHPPLVLLLPHQNRSARVFSNTSPMSLELPSPTPSLPPSLPLLQQLHCRVNPLLLFQGEGGKERRKEEALVRILTPWE